MRLNSGGIPDTDVTNSAQWRANADSTVIERVDETFGKWARQVTKQTKVRLWISA